MKCDRPTTKAGAGDQFGWTVNPKMKMLKWNGKPGLLECFAERCLGAIADFPLQLAGFREIRFGVVGSTAEIPEEIP